MESSVCGRRRSSLYAGITIERSSVGEFIFNGAVEIFAACRTPPGGAIISFEKEFVYRGVSGVQNLARSRRGHEPQAAPIATSHLGSRVTFRRKGQESFTASEIPCG